MTNEINKGGIVAIPLKPREGFALSPNYFVIESMQGKVVLPVNPVTMQEVQTDCTLITYRIVFREILEEDIELGKPQELEDVVLRNGSLQMPIEYVPMLFSLERVYQNLEAINYALSKFTFRGILSGFELEIETNLNA